jgi:signal peptidase I
VRETARVRAPGSGQPGEHRSTSSRLFGAVLLVAVLALVGVVRLFVVEPFYVPTPSMAPTLRPGAQAFASKLAYSFGSPHRGDIVVLESPRHGHGLLVKRVVGLPGQRVEVRDGVLLVDRVRQRESYVDYPMVDSTFFGPVTVPPHHVFVMGDNRANSLDSRVFGAVPESDLLGKVFAHVN